jgi:iron-sulfur cluster assembly protein
MSPIHQEPTDAIIHLAPKAMIRLLELREKQCISSPDPHSTDKPYLILRMGVRNGGCSGMSYVMDFATEDSITDEDQVDLYEKEGIKCVVDSKSMLYLYDMQLDYSDALIGGGFKFYNPNSQETCGCGSSFSI